MIFEQLLLNWFLYFSALLGILLNWNRFLLILIYCGVVLLGFQYNFCVDIGVLMIFIMIFIWWMETKRGHILEYYYILCIRNGYLSALFFFLYFFSGCTSECSWEGCNWSPPTSRSSSAMSECCSSPDSINGEIESHNVGRVGVGRESRQGATFDASKAMGVSAIEGLRAPPTTPLFGSNVPNLPSFTSAPPSTFLSSSSSGFINIAPSTSIFTHPVGGAGQYNAMALVGSQVPVQYQQADTGMDLVSSPVEAINSTSSTVSNSALGKRGYGRFASD